MKCSAYIATSADGFIARLDDGIDWLETAGKPEAGHGEGYVDFASYLATVDCLIMGRKTMELISSLNLPPEQWPYGSLKIIVLSTSLKTPPENMTDKVELYSGDLGVLLKNLEGEGHRHAYVDGGTTIQAFINRGHLDEIIVTQLPILIGEGKPLFGKTEKDVHLSGARAVVSPNDHIQIRYQVEKET